MTNRLGDRIREQMAQLGKNNKAVASSAHDYMLKAVGSATEKLETVTGKLSKLLNGNPEGIAYFFAPEHQRRIEALAHAVGIEVKELHAWRMQENVPTLVLDPRLTPDVIRFIRSQADDRAASYRCVEVEQPAHPTNDARVDAAVLAELDKHVDPIAVIATSAAMEKFSFAKRRATLVRKVPRGYELEMFPGLVPIPAPAPPCRFNEAGLPVVPLLELHTSRDSYEPFAHELGEIERLVIVPATVRGEIPCLSVKDFISWNTRAAGPFKPVLRGERYNRQHAAPIELTARRSLRLEHLLAFEDAQTAVWVEDKCIYALGPQAAMVAAVFAPHHEVTEPESLVALRARILDSNPWQLLEDAERTDDPLNQFLAELKPWAQGPQTERATAHFRSHVPLVGRLVPNASHPVRDRLQELAGYGAASSAWSLLFALARSADAPLLTFEDAESIGNDAMSVLADLGGGHLLQLRVTKLSGRRLPLTKRTIPQAFQLGLQSGLGELYDGGDVLVSASWSTDTNLEGWSPPARRRRAVHEEYSTDDD